MRPLTEEETRSVFEKLTKYIGSSNIELLLEKKKKSSSSKGKIGSGENSSYCFRLHRDRVFYVSELAMKRAAHCNRKQLVSLGTCFGKLTKSRQFRLHITALDYLAPYAERKLWLKSEQSFLYGDNVLKSAVGRVTETTEKYSGLVVFNMADVPIGFGVAAKSAAEMRHADPTAIVAFHQADVGEYIRREDELV